MKTSQINPASMGRIPDPSKNAANRKDNPASKQSATENSAASLKQARAANRAEILSSLKQKAADEKLTKDLENASPEISEYMKMISRFENKVKQDEIEDKDLERIMKALEDKVLSMTPQQQNRLKSLELFKTKGIENFKNMKETLIELFENKADRETFFDFLKSPDFVTILLNEPDLLNGYQPPTKAGASSNANAPKAAQTSQGTVPDTSGPKPENASVNPKPV